MLKTNRVKEIIEEVLDEHVNWIDTDKVADQIIERLKTEQLELDDEEPSLDFEE